MKFLLAFFTTVLLIGTHQTASAQLVKFGTLAPEGSPWYEIIRDMGEAWRIASNGEVDLRIYPGGVAGDDSDMVRKMRIGQLHAAALTSEGLSRISPEVMSLQLPMMVDSYEELNYIRNGMSADLNALLEAKGFKVLIWADAGWVYFFSQEPVVHPNDLKSMKLFTWLGDTTYVEAWKDAGYQPVPLSSTEILTSLQSGLINAFPTTPLAALSFQWYSEAKNMTDLKWAPLVGALVISTKTWQKFPENLRPAILEAAEEAGARVRQAVPQLDAEAIEAMEKFGLQVHAVPPEIQLLWEERARASYSVFVDALIPAEMVAKVGALRTEFRNQQQ
jgi:TRAP-type C4-dicarboxylate transport system substrate-binding protein